MTGYVDAPKVQVIKSNKAEIQRAEKEVEVRWDECIKLMQTCKKPWKARHHAMEDGANAPFST
jgi:hypothetical protein